MKRTYRCPKCAQPFGYFRTLRKLVRSVVQHERWYCSDARRYSRG